MVDVPYSVPREIRAGDTAKWKRSLADYPASASWVLSYTLISSTAVFSFSATADGHDHSVVVAKTASALWPAGSYQLQEYVSKAAERFTLGTTTVRILANLAAVSSGGLDVRSHARKTLDALEAWIESSSPAVANFEIAGRKLQHHPVSELLVLLDRYRAEVAREERVASGRPGRILTRL